MKYIITILTLLILPLTSQAASALKIYLLYENSQMSFASPAIEQDKNTYISISDFTDKNEKSIGPFILKITNWLGDDLVVKKFSTQTGRFSLTVPYYPTVKHLSISETNNNKIILEKDLSEISTCNTNNICEFEKGETASTCLLDCGVSQPKYSKETKQLLKNQNGIIENNEGKVLLKENVKSSARNWAIMTIAIIAIIIAGFIIIRKKYAR